MIDLRMEARVEGYHMHIEDLFLIKNAKMYKYVDWQNLKTVKIRWKIYGFTCIFTVLEGHIWDEMND
jgi:hypothetical protein